VIRPAGPRVDGRVRRLSVMDWNSNTGIDIVARDGIVIVVVARRYLSFVAPAGL
jgi:hypothetical protein